MSGARLLVSAAHKSSGKTTVSIGLCAALRRAAMLVQPFKKGPDYIDPMWLGQAAGRACFNLDSYLIERRRDRCLVRRAAPRADLSLVEGNKGLYDGLALDGSNSNAALAKLLGLPVVLVHRRARHDARHRAADPRLPGLRPRHPHRRRDPQPARRRRHEAKLRAVIEHYTDVPVLGAVQHDAQLQLVERHLGLMPSQRGRRCAGRASSALGRAVAEQVDLERVLELARRARRCPGRRRHGHAAARAGSGASRVRIGIARDQAFGFYYPDDLDALRAAGAELVPFDTLRDAGCPSVDGLFIGGGFPEMFMAELEANAACAPTSPPPSRPACRPMPNAAG